MGSLMGVGSGYPHSRASASGGCIRGRKTRSARKTNFIHNVINGSGFFSNPSEQSWTCGLTRGPHVETWKWSPHHLFLGFVVENKIPGSVFQSKAFAWKRWVVPVLLPLICWNWFGAPAGFAPPCPPPPSGSILSLLPPPCLPFLN